MMMASSGTQTRRRRCSVQIRVASLDKLSLEDLLCELIIRANSGLNPLLSVNRSSKYQTKNLTNMYHLMSKSYSNLFKNVIVGFGSLFYVNGGS